MGDFAVSGRVVSQNRMGRFIRACEHAATQTVNELIEEGAEMSRELAPVGSRVDMRSIPLAQSIETHMISSTQGVWRATARHALHQEYGTSRHWIPGNPYLSFFWENAGRWWVPGLYGPQDMVDHPGHEAANAGQGYLRPAFKMLKPRILAILRSRYP